VRRRLLFSYLTLTAFVLAILEIPLGLTFASHERRALTAAVERDAFVMASFAEDVLEGTGTTNLQLLATRYQRRTQGRVVIVNGDGFSIADSKPTTPGERDFSTRPEIKRALAGDISSGVRHSVTLGTGLLYVAVPVASGGVVHGAVRITYPMSAVESRIARNWLVLGAVAMVVLLAASVVGWRFAASVSRPLRDLETTAATMAGGDLSNRAPAVRGPPEVRSVARTFNDMASQLEGLVDAQRAFVADASHQLRTPLTALRLRLENLEDAVPPALQEDADAAAREAWRLERIVDGLLALARAEASPTGRQIEDVGVAIEERRIAWAPLAEERSLSLKADADGVGGVLELPGALEQILDNLLANAIDAAPTESAIDIIAKRNGHWAEIHVIDHGPGMSSEERARAFDRFWRGSANDEGGSGLGLAIVRQLARTSGGDASLVEAEGGGIDAVVRLPIA